MTRIEQEKKTVRQMVEIYCHGKKHAPARGSRTGKSLCEACSALLDYAYQRLDHCKFGEQKPTCKKCHSSFNICKFYEVVIERK